jgi:2-phosphosulfolactate phosphatase
MRVHVEWFPPAGEQADWAPRGWPAERSRWTGVAIDVLRATSTLTVALGNGAARVIPLTSPEEALAMRERVPGTLACGERDGRKVPGFDLGNSPLEYTAERVTGRSLAFASTNGSRAFQSLAGCEGIVLASFLNASAVALSLERSEFVRIVCAGQLGAFAIEDAACAGWLCVALKRLGARLDGAASSAAVSLAPRDETQVRALLQGASHGQALRRLGSAFAADVDECSRLDSRSDVHTL